MAGTVEDGVLKTFDQTTHNSTTITGSESWWENVTSIENSVFSSNNVLTSVTIPEGVTTIGNNFFMSSTSLTTLILPGSLTTIGSKFCFGCNNLTSVKFGSYGTVSQLTSIPSEAFVRKSSSSPVITLFKESQADLNAVTYLGPYTLTLALTTNKHTAAVNSGFTGEDIVSVGTINIPGENELLNKNEFSVTSSLLRHKLIKYLFLIAESSRKSFKSKRSDINIADSSIFTKTNINVVKAGGIVDITQVIDSETGWYSSIENDENIIVKPRTGDNFIIARANDQYTVSLQSGGSMNISSISTTNGTLDTNGSGYLIEGDSVTINGEPMILGGVGGDGSDDGSSGNEGSAGGDPYVKCLNGELFKMDNITGNCRLLQGKLNDKDLIINVEMVLDNNEIEKNMNNWSKNEEKFKKTPFYDNFDTDQVNQSFFTKVYIGYGESWLILDIEKSEFVINGSDISIKVVNNRNSGLPMYSNGIADNTVEISIGGVSIYVLKFVNRQIRTEIDIIGANLISNKYGFIVNPMNTDYCKIETLASIENIDIMDKPEFKNTIEETFCIMFSNDNYVWNKLKINCY